MVDNSYEIDYRGRGDYLANNETEDLRDKLNVMTNKYITVRKERDQFMKENKELQNEILILQSNIRQMIPGFTSNTSCSFPMQNELQNKMSEFFKIDCQDIFFDILSPELNMDGIVFFFKQTFYTVQEMINAYFEPMENILLKTLAVDEMWSPIENVLRKSYQSNWKKIFTNISNEQNYSKITTLLQNNLKLQDESPGVNRIIQDFIKKATEVLFFCKIADPQIILDSNAIGQKIQFNPTKHESVDGFIKQKHECVVILPSCHKGTLFLNTNEYVVIKSQVLPCDYEFP